MKTTSLASLATTIFAFMLLHVSADQIYVAQEGSLQVSTVTDGRVQPYANGVGLVYGLAADGSGNLYAAGAGNDTIYKVNSSGAVSTFASSSVLGSPSGLAINAAGNLYTSGNGLGGTVDQINSCGAVDRVLTGVGGFGLTFDSSGNAYIADGNTVYRMTPSGAVSTFATGFNDAWGLAFHNGNLFVANYLGNSISEVSPSGAVHTFATGLSLPTGIAFDSSGNLFVCNWGATGSGSLDCIAPNGSVTTVVKGLCDPTAIVIVPEPQALGLVVLGGVAMVARRKRAS